MAVGWILPVKYLKISPTTAILLFVYQESSSILKQAIQVGVKDTFFLPMRNEDLLKMIHTGLAIVGPQTGMDAAGNAGGNSQSAQPDDGTGNPQPVEPVHYQPTGSGQRSFDHHGCGTFVDRGRGKQSSAGG